MREKEQERQLEIVQDGGRGSRGGLVKGDTQKNEKWMKKNENMEMEEEKEGHLKEIGASAMPSELYLCIVQLLKSVTTMPLT